MDDETQTTETLDESSPETTRADAEDGGWDVESASMERGPTPADTTSAEGRAHAGLSARENQAESEEEEDDNDGIESAGTPATAVEKKAPQAGKGAKSSQTRKAQIQAEIDGITARRYAAQAELDRIEQRLAAARGDQGQPVARPTERPTQAQPRAEAGGLPPMPRLADFDSEDDYNAAVETWLDARDSGLEQRLAQGLESRLAYEAAQRQQAVALAGLKHRLSTARAKYADWDQKVGNIQSIQSPWSDPQAHGPTPFLTDLVRHAPEGGDILYFVASDPERGQALANLLPTRSLRDAIVMSPSPLVLLEHFATPEGAQEFEELKAMHPVRQLQAVGALTARLTADQSGNGGPAGGVHPITSAAPPAKPLAGSPRARGQAPAGPPASFDAWMAAEDAKELAERKRTTGVSVG